MCHGFRLDCTVYTQDLELLTEAKEKILEDPGAFVRCLQDRENISLPGKIHVQPVRRKHFQPFNVIHNFPPSELYTLTSITYVRTY